MRVLRFTADDSIPLHGDFSRLGSHQDGDDWTSPSHIPSSVEAEIVVAAVGLPLVPQNPVTGCFVHFVLPPLT